MCVCVVRGVCVWFVMCVCVFRGVCVCVWFVMCVCVVRGVCVCVCVCVWFLTRRMLESVCAHTVVLAARTRLHQPEVRLQRITFSVIQMSHVSKQGCIQELNGHPTPRGGGGNIKCEIFEHMAVVQNEGEGNFSGVWVGPGPQALTSLDPPMPDTPLLWKMQKTFFWTNLRFQLRSRFHSCSIALV